MGVEGDMVVHQLHVMRFVDDREGGNAAPFRPWSLFGCGTSLVFYRPQEPGVFLADVWITIFYLPLLPLSNWVIIPKWQFTSEQYGTMTETFAFEYLETRAMTLIRFLAMLNRAVGRINALLGPAIVALLYLIWNDRGRPILLPFVLFLASLGWTVGMMCILVAKRDRIFEQGQAQRLPGRDPG
jgi:hypothetical protein